MYTLQPGSDYDKKNPFHHFQKKKDIKKALSSFISMDSNTRSFKFWLQNKDLLIRIRKLSDGGMQIAS